MMSILKNSLNAMVALLVSAALIAVIYGVISLAACNIGELAEYWGIGQRPLPSPSAQATP